MASSMFSMGRADRTAAARWFWTIDRPLLAMLLVLMGLGLIAVAAASPAAAMRYSGGAVQLELSLPDGIVDPRRCDCSICRRKGAIVASVPLSGITIVRGADVLRLPKRVAPGEAVLLEAALAGTEAAAPPRPVPAAEAFRAPRLGLENSSPAVEGGRFPVKRLVGETVEVEVDVICDGHEKLAAALRWFELPRSLAAALAGVASAVLFSAAHHVGPYGQEYSNFLFVFRLVPPALPK